MDPKLTEVAQLFERFKAGFVRNDLDTCSNLLSQLKVNQSSQTLTLKVHFFSLQICVRFSNRKTPFFCSFTSNYFILFFFCTCNFLSFIVMYSSIQWNHYTCSKKPWNLLWRNFFYSLQVTKKAFSYKICSVIVISHFGMMFYSLLTPTFFLTVKKYRFLKMLSKLSCCLSIGLVDRVSKSPTIVGRITKCCS